MKLQKIVINDYGKETKAIWLGEFCAEVQKFIYKKRFFRKKEKVEIVKELKKYYIVFVPYIDELKEIKILQEELILDKNIDISTDNNIIQVSSFTSYNKDEDEYINSIEIRDFVGYNFIYKNNGFIFYNYYNSNDLYCLDILYKNIPSLAVLRLEDKQKENLIFKDIIQIKNGKYLELAYNKEDSPKKIFKTYKMKNYDSLYITIEDFNYFFKDYLPLLEECISPDKTNKFCYYGLNYYTKEKTKTIFDMVKNSDLSDRNNFLIWLYKAYSFYNGFYIYGI